MMGARGEREEGERDFEVVTVVIEEQTRSVTKANERENKTKSNQSQIQNQCPIFPAPSSMKSEKNQLVSDEDENNSNGLVEIIEVDATVEADEDSNTENESEHRGVDAKEEKFNEGVIKIVVTKVLELNEVGENSTDLAADVVPCEDNVEESKGEGDHQTDILTPALSLLIFNITIPCVDFFFDAALIRILFSNNWGCLFILVCSLAANFLFTTFAWWRIEPKSQKTWSWIFLILQIWPQLKAVQV